MKPSELRGRLLQELEILDKELGLETLIKGKPAKRLDDTRRFSKLMRGSKSCWPWYEGKIVLKGIESVPSSYWYYVALPTG